MRNEIEFDSIEEEVIGMSNYEQHRNSSHYKVYKDLKERGFYVTSGFKYGVDFLVYKEDPNFVHSEFFLNVYEKNENVHVKELIKGERLGVSTKKKFLAAFVNEINEVNVREEKKINYLNFEWMNI